jgi:hypothetical protein
MSGPEAGKPFSPGRKGFGYLLLGLFAVMMLTLLFLGIRLLVHGLFMANLSAKVRVLMIAAAAFAFYTPLRVGFGMLQRRRSLNRRG